MKRHEFKVGMIARIKAQGSAYDGKICVVTRVPKFDNDIVEVDILHDPTLTPLTDDGAQAMGIKNRGVRGYPEHFEPYDGGITCRVAHITHRSFDRS